MINLAHEGMITASSAPLFTVGYLGPSYKQLLISVTAAGTEFCRMHIMQPMSRVHPQTTSYEQLLVGMGVDVVSITIVTKAGTRGLPGIVLSLGT